MVWMDNCKFLLRPSSTLSRIGLLMVHNSSPRVCRHAVNWSRHCSSAAVVPRGPWLATAACTVAICRSRAARCCWCAANWPRVVAIGRSSSSTRAARCAAEVRETGGDPLLTRGARRGHGWRLDGGLVGGRGHRTRPSLSAIW